MSYGGQENAAVIRSDTVSEGGNVSKYKLDATDIYHIQEELSFIDDTQYRELKSNLLAMELFPIKLIDPGAEVYKYTMLSSTGRGKYAADKANDAPNVNATRATFIQPIASVHIALEYSQQDLYAARYSSTGKDYLIELRNQALRGNLETMNNTCFLGFPEEDLKGVITHPSVTDKAVVKSNTNWTTASAAQIYADLQDGYQSPFAATNNLLRPDTCLMSLNLYNIIEQAIFNTFSGQTILRAFESSTGVKIIPCAEVNTAFNSTKAGFMMYRNDPNCIQHVVATFFENTPPQPDGWIHRVFCKSRHGGIVIRHPKTISQRYMP